MNLLIVEDNPEIAFSLKKSFEEEGFAVDDVFDGILGLKKAKTHDYDLIILDLGLPRKGGKEICAELRQAGKNMPIIMLSVESDENTKVELLSIGADDYVTKPFSFSELSARVKACLRRPRGILEKVCTFKNVSLDRNSRIVSVDGKEVHLTPKEFFILEYMMRHMGQVVSRQEILEHIWGSEQDLFTNTLETHMVNLRKKIKGKEKRDIISTVQGGGYKIG